MYYFFLKYYARIVKYYKALFLILISEMLTFANLKIRLDEDNTI